MEWYYVWWPWLTSKRVAQVCQHQLSFLFIARQHAMQAEHDIVLPLLSVCLSVCLSVYPMPVLCLNEWTYHTFWVSVRGIILVFSSPLLQNSKVNPLSVELYTRGREFFLQISPFISETVWERAIVTVEHWQEITRSQINPCLLQLRCATFKGGMQRIKLFWKMPVITHQPSDLEWQMCWGNTCGGVTCCEGILTHGAPAPSSYFWDPTDARRVWSKENKFALS